MHVLDAVLLPFPPSLPTSQSKGLIEEGGRPVKVMVSLTIIPVSQLVITAKVIAAGEFLCPRFQWIYYSGCQEKYDLPSVYLSF